LSSHLYNYFVFCSCLTITFLQTLNPKLFNYLFNRQRNYCVCLMIGKMQIAFRKVKNKIISTLKEIIYYNYYYRPSAVYQTSKDYQAAELAKGRKVHYIEIYPQLHSRLEIDAELYKACSHYFIPVRETVTTYLVIEVPGGRIHTDNDLSVAVISRNNRLIGDVSFSYKEGRIIAPAQNAIFRQKYFKKPHRVKGTVFSLLTGGSGTNNYSHWLIDVLPRIHLLKKSGLYAEVDFFVTPSCKHDFQRDTLAMLGIGPEKIIRADEYPHIQADTLIASTAPRGDTTIIPYWLCDFLKKAFFPKNIQYQYPPYIYLSRKDSSMRVVANEDQLTAMLEQYNFETFVLSELSFEQKINLFAGADIIISATGAGMTNMVFCRKGTRIVELFNEGFVVGPFYDMAPKLELDYHYIIFETNSRAKNLKQGQKEDLVVDLEKVRRLLNTLCADATIQPDKAR
jgi:capsular polysaccharide biosynthesis protein